ncbi:unnamed protein product [Rhizoctonia solani]|uniref:Uncharacterized protein n=1 Tax=Rhizoctonia solani TaxID=456999 RepID=A0A8H2WZA5_9AGAM|nr:unnamed protein product [Rhizoctonia solani]
MNDTNCMDVYNQPNLDDLAATIALASDALAAAAEALAEASRAMSDVSSKFNRSEMPESSSTIPQLVEIGEQSGLVDNSTNNKNQHAEPELHADSQIGLGTLETTSRPSSVLSISSESDSEVEVISDSFLSHGQVSGPSCFQAETTNNLHGSCTETGSQLYDQLPSPAPPNPNSRILPTRYSSDKRDQGLPLYFSRLLEVMGSYPKIPPGRNYIYFDQDSEGLAFVAYMALHANRMICIIPDDMVDGFSRLLESLTHANVHRADTPDQFTRISTEIGPFDMSYCDIFCTSSSKFILNAASCLLLSPDCTIHWGLPSSSYYYIALATLPPTARNCVMEIGEYHFDESTHMIQPYPQAVIDTCFQPNSPFEALLRVSSRLVSGFGPPNYMETDPFPAGTYLYPGPLGLNDTSTLVPLQSHWDVRESFPPGHFYIVLDNSDDIEIIPIIGYISSVVNKVICCIPSSRMLRTTRD